MSACVHVETQHLLLAPQCESHKVQEELLIHLGSRSTRTVGHHTNKGNVTYLTGTEAARKRSSRWRRGPQSHCCGPQPYQLFAFTHGDCWPWRECWLWDWTAWAFLPHHHLLSICTPPCRGSEGIRPRRQSVQTPDPKAVRYNNPDAAVMAVHAWMHAR